MKTNNILKTGFFAIAFAALSIGTNAQTLLPSTPNPPGATDYTVFTTTGGESVDSVTVGSRMPYKVDAQDPVTGLTFEYKWLFSPALTIQDLGGATLTGSNDYYAANEISVVMPGTVPTGDGGKIKIGTNVQSLVEGTVLCSAENDTEYTIQVVAKPTLSWPTPPEVILCGNKVPVNIPFELTGYGQWEVYYEVYYTASTSGATRDKVVPETKVAIGNYGSKLGPYSFDLPAVDFEAPGKYEIQITNLTDRISRKSLTPIVATAGADIPTALYTVNVYPAPTTKPLQHVKNMP